MSRFLILGVLAAFLLAGCVFETDQATQKRIGELEERVSAIERKLAAEVPQSASMGLVDGWKFNGHPLFYLGTAFVLAVLVRICHSGIKTFSSRAGEHDERNIKLKGDVNAKISDWPRRKIFLTAFHGFAGTALDDHWLGTIIGLAEILFFPVLIITGNFAFIGGWLAIKTAGGWEAWRKQPRAFNRFLISSLMNITIAYFIMLNVLEKA